jgi:hypothetical protein
MTEKELLQQLNKLKTVQLGAEVKAQSRSVLLAQISQGEPMESLGFFAKVNILFSRTLQPYTIASLVAVVLVVGAGFGWQNTTQAKPGEAFYSAKRLSERAKMFMAFTEKAQTNLNLEFASNRAMEISELSQADNGTKENLKNEFRKEIGAIKARLAGKFKPTVKEDNNLAKKDDNFKTAGTDKNAPKVDISVPKKNNNTSTSTVDNNSLTEVLEEVKKSVDKNDYNKASDKLDEASVLIDKVK